MSLRDDIALQIETYFWSDNRAPMPAAYPLADALLPLVARERDAAARQALNDAADEIQGWPVQTPAAIALIFRARAAASGPDTTTGDCGNQCFGPEGHSEGCRVHCHCYDPPSLDECAPTSDEAQLLAEHAIESRIQDAPL